MITCIVHFATDDACQSIVPLDREKAHYTSINQILSSVSKWSLEKWNQIVQQFLR